ncbi:hypothetical protein K9L16_02405 [Candidatus Pacearchaeota archaeon]|nr:hypothetical protein [Candidatus Pacearchaeota archaeon]
MLQLPGDYINNSYDWNLIGRILASPKQRLVVLKTIAMDPIKRTSENIRKRADRFNPCLSRISIKGVLQDLAEKGLVQTDLGDDKKRYYWISEKGKKLVRINHQIKNSKIQKKLLKKQEK